MLSQVSSLVFIAIMAANAMTPNTAMNCTNYLTTCNPQNQMTCCMFPIVLCLPDNKGTASCISPLDVANISPKISTSAPYSKYVAALENATMSLMTLAPSLPPSSGFYGMLTGS